MTHSHTWGFAVRDQAGKSVTIPSSLTIAGSRIARYTAILVHARIYEVRITMYLHLGYIYIYTHTDIHTEVTIGIQLKENAYRDDKDKDKDKEKEKER